MVDNKKTASNQKLSTMSSSLPIPKQTLKLNLFHGKKKSSVPLIKTNNVTLVPGPMKKDIIPVDKNN